MVANYLDHIGQTIEALPHCRKIGFKISALSQGEGEAFLKSRPEFKSNPLKDVMHSALVTTLLDTLCGAVASSAYEGGRTVATLDLRLDHLAALDLNKDLYAMAKSFHCNDDIVYVNAYAWQDSKENPVAKATGSFMASGSFHLRPKGLAVTE